MTLAELARAGRAPQAPSVVALDDEALHVERWLRVLPGQRYVAQARWGDTPVLAKLYVGSKAQRHAGRERRGVEALQRAGVPTPALLGEGRTPAGAWLLFQFIERAETLGAAWARVEHEHPLSVEQETILGQALAAVASLHAQGVCQADLHLDNLLCDGSRVWVIDGAAVQRSARCPLESRQAEANLGLLLAQLPGSILAHLERLLPYYQRAAALNPVSLDALRAATQAARKRRIAKYLEKVGRDCTAFRARHSLSSREVVLRSMADQLEPLLRDPDAAIAQGLMLKDGGSATVARVDLPNGPVVLKRYNIKGLGHWLKRFWRPTRAWHSWVEGHRLDALGIASPRPLAVIERRWLGLRGRSYLITEYAPGEDIIARFEPHRDGAPPECEVQALVQLFSDLARERIVHGDLKGTNVLWQDSTWSLIDLDSAGARSGRRLLQGQRRDRARFLRNWPEGSALRRLLDQRLPAVPARRDD